ncbi:type III secretion system protein PrgH [Providencia sp. wls1914]|nr:PrgH/EprH family type III secretion apparatus protein [Providencia sp. wls1914]MTC69495.1 type III secretion system protein PrgH [Providencia sp. wls1914]
MIETKHHTCIMKIISGSMNSQELVINIDKNIIIVGQHTKYKTEIDENGFTTYYIPSEHTQCEFSIVSNDESNNNLAINLKQDGKNRHLTATLQEILLIDTFPIAIKPLNTEWNYSKKDQRPLPSQSLPFAKKSPIAIKQKLTFNKKYFFVFLLLFAVIFILFVEFQNNPKNNAEKQIKNIDNILKGSYYPITYTQNKKGEVLILVKSQRDEDWSRQVLLKSDYQAKYTIKNINSLEQEIEDKLIDTIPNLLKIDISNPCQPIIRVVKSPLPNNDDKNIYRILSNYFSCYKQSQLVQVPLEELIKKAELGLTESNVKWQRITKGNYVIFVIRDSLNDKQTLSLISFTNSFSQKWGTKQIQFSVSLSNNELAGKSFITNSNGITLLGNNHWLFNSIRPN